MGPPANSPSSIAHAAKKADERRLILVGKKAESRSLVGERKTMGLFPLPRHNFHPAKKLLARWRIKPATMSAKKVGRDKGMKGKRRKKAVPFESPEGRKMLPVKTVITITISNKNAKSKLL